MWARTVIALATAAAALGGCAMERPLAGMARRLPPRATQGDVAAFDEAIALTVNFEYEAAAAKFQQVLPRFEFAGDARRAAESMFWLGFCRERQGRTAQARGLYKRVVTKYPRQQVAEKARQRLEGLPAEDTPATPGKGS